MNNINQIKNLMETVRNSSNPQALFGAMMVQNPQMRDAVATINNYGDGRTAFYEIAKQRGIDPEVVLNMLK